MASSLPAALDYLVAQTRALPAMVPPVVVQDGWPTSRSDQMVVFGIDPDEDESGMEVSYQDLSGTEHETVEVPNLIAVRMVGSSAASRARVQVFDLYDAVRALIRSDRTLGGAITPGFKARIGRYAVRQTAEPAEAGSGRWCEIRWVLGWQHRG